MKNHDKTKDELINELTELRKRLAKLEGERGGTQPDITEKKKAEAALKESEEKFRDLAEESPNMIFINQRGRVVYANRRCEEIMSYKREEFYDPEFDFITLIAPEFRDLIRSNFRRHTEGHEIAPCEYALITKEGKRIEAIITSKLMKYEGENAILGIVTDITQCKKTEEYLKKYRFMVESAHDAIFLKDLESRYIIANNKALEAFGLSREEVIGKNDYELMPNREEAEKNVADDQYVYKTGKPTEVTKHMTGVDGRECWFQAIKVPQFDDKGNITGLVGIARDISKEKRLEKELEKHREHLEDLVKERTEQLKEKVAEMERFIDIAVGRELKMAEMEKETESLRSKGH
ncbi:MAG: PAS domain S-box protein [bacterium]